MRSPQKPRGAPEDADMPPQRGTNSDYFADLVREELEGTAEAARRWLQVIRDSRK